MLRRKFLSLKRKRRILSYRIKPKEDSRNRTARAMDLAVVIFILWIASLALLNKYFEMSFAFPASLVLALGGGIIVCYLRARQKQVRLRRYNLWLAGQTTREEVKKIRTREELAVFISLLLAGLPHFEHVHINYKGKKKELRIDESMALTVKDKRGFLIGVQCLPAESSRPEEVKWLQSFKAALEEREFKGALIVAPGPLYPEARSMISEIKKRYNLFVLDEDKLVDLTVQVKRQPGDKAGEVDRGHNKTEATLLSELIFDHKKGKSYLMTAGALLFVYFISGAQGFGGHIYLGLIFVNVALALRCFWLGLRDEDTFDLGESQT